MVGTLRLKSAAWLAALLLLVPGCSEAPEEPGRVDIVLYVVDTLRRDRLGVYGYEKPTSPNLDALARVALVFDNAYAPGPWTLPSVVSMLTSASPIDHGINVPGEAIPRGFATLPRRLAQLGYRTAAFSSNPLIGPPTALDAQFEHFEWFRRELKTGPIERWLDAVGEDPFFLYVQPSEPHEPYEPPEEHLERIGSVPPGTAREIGELTMAWRRTRSPRSPELVERLTSRSRELDVLYDATVAWADARMGKLLRELRRRGRWERTLFVFVSDHGEELFDHGALLHGQSLYAELVRIPMIWRLPDLDGDGRRIATAASLVDVMPTLLAYLGRPDLAQGCLGRSLLDDMRGASGSAQTQPRITSIRIGTPPLAAHPALGLNNVAVVDGRWKGIWNQDPDTFELYDTRADPEERSDVSSRYPEIAERLQKEAQRSLEERPRIEGLTGVREFGEVDREIRRKLERLGYVE